LHSKNILITGASRGIGKNIAKVFANKNENFIVGITTKWNASLPKYVDEWIEADFSNDQSLSSCCDKLTKMESFDVCINNAGINIIKPIDRVNKGDLSKIQKVNLEAPYWIISSIVPGMRDRGSGKIINISSIWSCISKENRSLYSTMKTGLVGMTRALAVEVAPDNILVNAVSPGFTVTDLTKKSLSEKQIVELSQSIPLGRLARADEIAKVVWFLASDQNTYLTGQNIVVDGGFTIV
jgi:NAD(P)-dependent dehydrogenase (short-subunit alcohol dehydrogenase family)